MKKKGFIKLFLSLALFSLPITACSMDFNGGGNGGGNSGDNTPVDPSGEGQGGGGETVTKNVLTNLRITKPANKTIYHLNDQPDYTGMEVTASFSKSSDRIIPHNELTFTGFDSSSAGEKTVRVEYTFEEVTKGVNFTINVRDGSFVTLDFYGFNDTHGNVVDTSLGVGIAKTSTFMKQKTANQNALLISSGDMWQGSLESNSNRGELMTQWMEYLNFTSMTIGNHEFDWGTNSIKNISEKYNLPILGINTIDKTTGQRADYVTPSTVVERGGVKVGIIGAIGNCYGSISYSQVMDVEFVLDRAGQSTQPLTDLIKAESTRLRNEENCDLIVYSFHGDSIRDDTYYNLELSSGGYVDVVLEGHKHSETHYQDNGGVWHFQSQADNFLAINHFSIDLEVNTKEFEVHFDENNDIYRMNTSEKYSLAEDAGTNALINQYNFAPYYQTLGYNSAFRSGREMRQLCADLYYEIGAAKWTEYADQITFGGGYISIRGEGCLREGNVTYAQLYNLFPFDNDIVLITMPGSQLKSVYFDTTNDNYFLHYSSYGEQLESNRSLVDDNERYYAVVDTYSYDYMLKWYSPVLVDRYSTTGYYARDVMADYAKDGRFDDRVVLLPDVTIEHEGTLVSPYSVAEAYTATKAVSYVLWAYVKGKVVERGWSPNGYLENVLIQDLDESRAQYQLNIPKLYKYDGGDENHKFESAVDVQVGDTLLVYGGLETNVNGISFWLDSVVISVNDLPIAGDSINNPLSVSAYRFLNPTSELYVFGCIGDILGEVTGEHDANITQFYLRGTHTLDFMYPNEYNDIICVNDGAYDFSFDESLNMWNFVEGANVVCAISPTTFKVVAIEESSTGGEGGEGGDPVTTIQHAGTLDDPYTVADALLAAGKYTNSADSPEIYCSGVVSRQGTRMGNIGDIGNVYIKDADSDNEILIYFLRKFEGATNDNNFESITDVAVGDRIVICGRPFTYNGTTPEFASGTYCVSINGTPTA